VLERTRRAVLVLGVSIVLLSECRSGGDSTKKPAALAEELSPRDLAAIAAADSAFAQAANSGNVDSLVAVYAGNAALLPPNLPPQKGRAAIRSFWGGFLNAYTVRFELGSDLVEGRGDLAYNMGHYRFTAVPKNKANPGVADEGKFLEVLKRQSDGSWKYVVDMYSSNLAPQH
jgi:ketosteroid isomerase-like protein